MSRLVTKAVHIGKIQIGDGAPVVVQSMTNTDTRNVKETVCQIEGLAAVGCEIVRVAVPDSEAAKAVKEIVAKSPVPIIADIHFNYRLALEALDSGVHGLRLNPGNIGNKENVKKVILAAKERKVPIRVGVNAGSLDKKILAKHGGVTAAAMVESALEHVRLLESMDFTDIKISVKASHVPLMVDAYRLLAKTVNYPLHIGVTEAGTLRSGTVKSAVGIGILLAEGIGDTIRVSLTCDPKFEVFVAYEILQALSLRRRGPELISCPTCGRTEIDLISIANQVEERLINIDKPIKVAVMGCVVNGPGEARDADVGIAGGKGNGVVFRKGKVVRVVAEKDLVEELFKEINIVTENM